MIRAARAGDTPQIAAIWNRVIRETALTFTSDEKTVAEIEEAIAGRPFLVAEAEGRVTGFANLAQFRGGRGYAHSFEHTIYVAEGLRGQGTGSMLLEAIEAEAVRAGGHVLVAGISSANVRGRDFHLARGFFHAGTVPEAGRKFGDWFDLWLLTKPLG